MVIGIGTLAMPRDIRYLLFSVPMIFAAAGGNNNKLNTVQNNFVQILQSLVYYASLV